MLTPRTTVRPPYDLVRSCVLERGRHQRVEGVLVCRSDVAGSVRRVALAALDAHALFPL